MCDSSGIDDAACFTAAVCDKHMHSALRTSVAWHSLRYYRHNPLYTAKHSRQDMCCTYFYLTAVLSLPINSGQRVCVVQGTHNGDSCYASMHNMPPSLLQLEQVHGYSMANRLTFKYQFCYISWRNVPNEKHVAYTEAHVTRWAILRCGVTYQRCFLTYLVATCYQDSPNHNFTRPRLGWRLKRI